MHSKYIKFKKRVVALRKRGRTYGEIRKTLGIAIPKSTLSYWCRGVDLPDEYGRRLNQIIEKNMEKGRAYALIINRIRRENYIKSVRSRVYHLREKLRDKDSAKIALAMLFLGEGSKYAKGFLELGNSDPRIIGLFMRLLRYCYSIDESKLRCTLQCRADQNIKNLEKFWSGVTKIPPAQFYKARIDPRTIGRPSRKLDYKGVCRIDYFSGDVFMELKQISTIVCEGR